MNRKRLLLGSILGIVAVVAVGLTFVAAEQSRAQELVRQSQDEQLAARFIEEYNGRLDEAKTLTKMAEATWNTAMGYYGVGAYADAITQFERAQSEYIQATEKYRQASAVNRVLIETEFAKRSPKLATYLEIRSLWVDAQVERHLAMFESGEQMEVALRSFVNGDYKLYEQALNKTNEKIVLHDQWVHIANTLLSKMRALNVEVTGA
ncbi:MAG: hypothetical protein ACE5PO_05735 [Candidatus Bathyarchaeia archaeon]